MTPAKSAGTFSKGNLTRPIALWGPAALAIFLYLPSLTFDRTFDDRFHVVPPSETPKQSLSQVCQTRYWGRGQGGGLYRPITTTTFWIEGKAHVPLPGRHMVNLLLYGAVTFLLVRLGLGLGMPPGPAGAAGVLFALHPVHVEAVAGLVGRAELLAALTLLLALLLHARRLHGSGTNPFLLLLSIGVLAFLGAGAKENAWLLPLFALPLHLIYRRSLLVAWPAWLGYVLGIGSHLVLRHHVLGGWLNAPDVVIAASDNPLVDLHGFERLIAGVRVVGENVLHLTVPVHLAPDYSGAHIRLDGGGTDGRLWLGLGFLILTVLLFRAGLRSRNTTSRAILVLSGCWLFVSGLFFMNLFLDLGTILADRLLFWPSTAWAILLGSIPLIKTKSLHRALNLVLMGFAVFYAWGSLKYIPDWRNEKALFASAVRVVPESGRNWYNLGRGLEAEGHLDDALNAIRRARTLDQNDFQSWAQEGEILIQQGKWDDARAPIATALRLNPRDPMSLSNEGVIWLRHAWREQGNDATMEIERSAARFRDVLTKDPEHIEALLNLALAEGRLGHVDTSEVMWRRYIERRPQDPKALDNLAWLLATQTNRFQEAEALARRATALSPSDPKMQLTLAEALWNQGKKDEAAQVAAQGLSLHPQPPLDTLLQRLVAGRSATSPE